MTALAWWVIGVVGVVVVSIALIGLVAYLMDGGRMR